MDIDSLPTQPESRPQVYCVTGGGGYVGSCLVKILLENGHTVHATLRDPSKNITFLRSLPGAQERLHLFRADLCQEGSFDSAIHGCHGVFHVASPMVFGECNDPENEIKMQAAIQGTLNVLKSCKKAERVRRLVFTSPFAAALPPLGKSLLVIDESCWTSLDAIRKTSSQQRFYRESKALAEKAALQFEGENPPLTVVSIVLPLVGGPSMSSRASLGVNIMLSFITGNQQLYGSLVQASYVLGNSVHLIQVQDACNAHLFLMEHPAAEGGRYLCCGHTTTIPELAHLISERYPQYRIKAKVDESVAAGGYTVSTKK